MKWFYYGLIPVVCAIIAGGYLKEDILKLITSRPEPNYKGISRQYIKEKNAEDRVIFDWALRKSGNDFYAAVKPEKADEKVWDYEGHIKDTMLAASYINRNADFAGVGSIYLKEKSGSYEGYIVGYDCDLDYIVKCPYVLIEKNKYDSKSSEFDKHLSDPCVKLFTPIEHNCTP